MGAAVKPVLCALIVTFLVAGCGGGGVSSQSNTPPTSNPPPPGNAPPPADDLPTVDPSVTGPLSTAQIENLAVLARVWGFVKYHHPKVANGSVNWDAELISVMPSILDAVDGPGRNAALFSWLESVGEPEPCNPCAAAPRDAYMPAAIDWIRDTALLGDALSAYLERVYENRFAGADEFYVSPAPGVGNGVFDNEAAYAQMTLPNGGYRLLALFRLWNIIEYLYPYRDLIGESWEGVLTDSIRAFYEAGSRDDYARALLEVFARINDTHANLWDGMAGVRPPQGPCSLPAGIRFIEHKATVAAYGHPQLGPASGLQIGDVILAIDGDSVDSLVAEWTPYYAASNEPTRLRDIARFMTRGACQAMKTSRPSASSAKPGTVVAGAAAGSEGTASPEPAADSVVPRAVATLGDFNGDSRTDIAVLLEDSVAVRSEVDVVDGGSGAVLAQIPFAPGPGVAKSFLVVPDITGDLIGEPAVLLDNTLHAEVRDATSLRLLGSPTFDSAFAPIAFLSVGDADGDTTPDLAVVGRGMPGGRVQAQVKSTAEDRLIRRFEFDARCEPCEAVVVNDVGDSAANEIALLGVDAAGRVSAEVRDSLTGAEVGRVYFDRDFEPLASAALPDGSGRLTFLGVLGRLEIKDLLTGASVGTTVVP